jgi:hypothetical protein
MADYPKPFKRRRNLIDQREVKLLSFDRAPCRFNRPALVNFKTLSLKRPGKLGQTIDIFVENQYLAYVHDRFAPLYILLRFFSHK